MILAVATLAALSALVPPSGAEAGGRPAVGLAAAPARVLLPAAETRTVRVLNPGRARVVVEARPAGYTLDVRGRPRIVADRAGSWLVAEPEQVVVPPLGSAELQVAARVPRGVRPGDHAALLLLTTRPLAGIGVPTRVRIGVVVVVRVPGRIVHRVAIVGVRLRRSGRARLLEIHAANRGNVDEWFGAGRVVVVLRAGGGVKARLHPAARRFLARSNGVLLARVPAAALGRVRVVVTLSRPRDGVAFVERAFWLRL